MFLAELSRKLAHKKREEEEAPKNVVRKLKKSYFLLYLNTNGLCNDDIQILLNATHILTAYAIIPDMSPLTGHNHIIQARS